MKKAIECLATGLVALTVSACAEMPVGGPSTRMVKSEAGPERYHLVRVTPETLAALAKDGDGGMAQTFTTGEPAPVQAISVGDVVSVTIWDLGSGLFSGAQAPNVTPGMSAITIAPASGSAEPDGSCTMSVAKALSPMSWPERPPGNPAAPSRDDAVIKPPSAIRPAKP